MHSRSAITEFNSILGYLFQKLKYIHKIVQPCLSTKYHRLEIEELQEVNQFFITKATYELRIYIYPLRVERMFKKYSIKRI